MYMCHSKYLRAAHHGCLRAATNQFTQPGYTPEHRESTEAVLTSYVRQIVAGVADARGLDIPTASAVCSPMLLRQAPFALSEETLVLAQVRRAMNDAPFTCTQAIERKLVDGAKYRRAPSECMPGHCVSPPRIPDAHGRDQG